MVFAMVWSIFVHFDVAQFSMLVFRFDEWSTMSRVVGLEEAALSFAAGGLSFCEIIFSNRCVLFLVVPMAYLVRKAIIWNIAAVKRQNVSVTNICNTRGTIELKLNLFLQLQIKGEVSLKVINDFLIETIEHFLAIC